jgi:hypothetical protein
MASEIERIFTQIYRSNAWLDTESKSGPGSTVFRTRLLRPQLTELVRNLGIRSLLDVPCGDFNWMRLTDLPLVEYIGADIVPEIIHTNTQLHARHDRRFVQLDMIHDSVPKADLILCRDGIVHFSFADIALALRSMCQSGSTYLLITTFTAHPRNENVATGQWRPLNLQIAPFLFPSPLLIVQDGPRPDGTFPDKVLALYRLSGLDESVRALNHA